VQGGYVADHNRGETSPGEERGQSLRRIGPITGRNHVAFDHARPGPLEDDP
jgi:hypothetical protein